MAKIIGEGWKNRVLDELSTDLGHKGYIDEVISYNPATQWLITHLTKSGIPFKVTNLGCGVKRITTKDLNICPKCGGSGKC